MSIISKETLVEKMKQYPTLLQQVMIMLDALGECLTTVNQYESDTKQAISDSKEAKENSATALTNSTEAKTSAADAVKKVNDITYDTKELMSNNKENVATSNFSLDLSKVNEDNIINLGNIADNIYKVIFNTKIQNRDSEIKFASLYSKYIADTDVDSIIYNPTDFNRGDIIIVTCSSAPSIVAPLAMSFTPSTTQSLVTTSINFAILIKCDGNNFLALFTTGVRTSLNAFYTTQLSTIEFKSLEENVNFTPILITAYDDNY